GDGAFLREHFFAAAKALAALALEGVGERRKQTKIDVHGLIGARMRRLRAGHAVHVAAGDMRKQRAVRARRRRRREKSAEPFGGGEATGEKSDGGGFDVALAAGDLAGKAQTRLPLEPQCAVEQLRRVEEGISVKAT